MGDVIHLKVPMRIVSNQAKPAKRTLTPQEAKELALLSAAAIAKNEGIKAVLMNKAEHVVREIDPYETGGASHAVERQTPEQIYLPLDGGFDHARPAHPILGGILFVLFMAAMAYALLT